MLIAVAVALCASCGSFFLGSSVFCFCFCPNGDSVPRSLLLSLSICWVIFFTKKDGAPISSYSFCLCQEKFIDMMENIITNKNSVRLTKDEGWYSEGEMKSELGWSSYIS